MFDKILIANRGEIALRIHRACKEMGIATVAVHSEADASAMHVRLADESVCIGPAPAAKSYLNIPAIIAACEITGAQADPSRLRLPLGERPLRRDRRGARLHLHRPQARAHPHDGRQDRRQGRGEDRRHSGGAGLGRRADSPRPRRSRRPSAIGFPVLIKAAAGGGGRGMKVARTREELPEALSTAQAEAKAAFGDDSVYLERYLSTPRHIEVQVIADAFGAVCHLGERDCSLQRRHQKLMEEAPSPAIDAATRDRDRRDRAPRRSPSSATSASAPSSSCTRTASSSSSR